MDSGAKVDVGETEHDEHTRILNHLVDCDGTCANVGVGSEGSFRTRSDTFVLGDLFRVLDFSTSSNVVKLSHDIVRSLDKVPDVEEATINIGGSPLRMRLNGCDEVFQAGGDSLPLLWSGKLRDGVGRHDGCVSMYQYVMLIKIGSA